MEIKKEWVNAVKEEVKEAVKEEVKVELEAKQTGWVEVVSKNLRKEAKKESQKDENLIVHTTLEEEKMRHARRLNIRVTGIKESHGSTPKGDGRTLCTKLGYKTEDPLPFTKIWRVGKDMTRKRALILQFASDVERTTFLKKRVILRDLPGEPIFLDDDLTRM